MTDPNAAKDVASKMRILVTGGSGFIGSRVAVALADQRHDVVALSRGILRNSSLHDREIKIVAAAVEDPASLETVRSVWDSCDAVYHLAACVDYFGDSKHLYRINVEGTRNVLNLARNLRARRMIFVSSVEVLGLASTEPLDEQAPPRPCTAYGASKLEAENVLLRKAPSKTPEIIIARLGNVYGPGSSWLFLPFAEALTRGNNVGRFMSRYAERQYNPLFIYDAVAGLLRLLDRGQNGDAYILSGDEKVTLGDLFQMTATPLNLKNPSQRLKKPGCRGSTKLAWFLRKLVTKPGLADFLDLKQGNAVHRLYSNERAKRELGFDPQTPLSVGIPATLAWLRKEALL